MGSPRPLKKRNLFSANLLPIFRKGCYNILKQANAFREDRRERSETCEQILPKSNLCIDFDHSVSHFHTNRRLVQRGYVPLRQHI